MGVSFIDTALVTTPANRPATAPSWLHGEPSMARIDGSTPTACFPAIDWNADGMTDGTRRRIQFQRSDRSRAAGGSNDF